MSLIWMGDLTKNGLEKWPIYTDNRTGKRTFLPKAKDDDKRGKAELLAEWLEKGEKFIDIGEDSRYKVAVGGVDLMFDDEIVPTLPPAGTTVLVKIEKFFSAKSKRDFYRLVGFADPDMTLAMLGVMVKKQKKASIASQAVAA